jgi:hypothetical protein
MFGLATSFVAASVRRGVARVSLVGLIAVRTGG